MDPDKLKIHTISLSDWLADAGFSDADAIRKEDNEKRERLAQLSELVGIPYDKQVKFQATELDPPTEEFQKFLKEHGNELCALRLIPLDDSVQKLRRRGHTIREAVVWFITLDIDRYKYRADFVPHSDLVEWSTIFIIGKTGIYGEIIAGRHSQLTQGHYDSTKPITFSYDFSTWTLTPDNSEAQKQLEAIVQHLYVSDEGMRQKVIEAFDAKFSNNYLCGYFETTKSSDAGLWFIDYNRILGHLYYNFSVRHETNDSGVVSGQCGYPGNVQGRVRLVTDPRAADIGEEEILVCGMTTPDHLPLMKKAAAFITDEGGILCHAAIVAREMKKPCIIGTINATQVLKDADWIDMDADRGIISLIK